MTKTDGFLSNPFVLIAFVVLIVSALAMGDTAKKYLGAKGYEEYLVVATGWGIFVYVRCTKERNGKIGLWFWVFLSALISLVALKYSISNP